MLDQKIAQFSLPRVNGIENADSISIQKFESNSFCVALADGVGKSSFSPNASRVATEIATSMPFNTGIDEIFERARLALIDGSSNAQGAVWSTTLTICKVSNLKALVGHVGDSRLYHLRGEGIMTRTRDQTELQVLLDEGVLSKERAKKYHRRNVLLSALSSDSVYDLQESSFEIAHGDRILLISDGVYKQILRKEIAALSTRASSVDLFISGLKNLLLSRGIVDDSSAVCIEIS